MFLNEALELAAQGIRVFPCNICKTPATPHGFHDASTDADEVRRLWHRHFGPLIGVPTGITFDVLDLDFPRHPESRIWWREKPASRSSHSGSSNRIWRLASLVPAP